MASPPSRSGSPRTVVVGGGVAGARFVRQFAALGSGGGELVWLGEEEHPAYNRVLLADVLAGRYPAEVAALPPAPPEAVVRRGVRVALIDRERAEVETADGERVGYDTLVLATGGNPVLSPLRGLPAGVHAFRTMDDCLGLAAESGPGVRVVVVGGGLLGVSAARALAARGADVVVAHQGEYLMDRFLDAGAGALVRGHLTALGVEVHTECRVRGVRTGAGRVTAVELADGYALETDVAVLACGVRPRTRLALDAGLTVRRGIAVDDALRTDDPRIHAIGDCAEHRGTVYGLAGAAREQADALAALLAGRAGAAYRGTRALTRLTLGAHGEGGPGPLDVASFGVTTEVAGDEVLRLADATRGAYRKVVLRGDRLVGGILLGDLGTVGDLARTWERDEPLPEQPLSLLTNGAPG